MGRRVSQTFARGRRHDLRACGHTFGRSKPSLWGMLIHHRSEKIHPKPDLPSNRRDLVKKLLMLAIALAMLTAAAPLALAQMESGSSVQGFVTSISGDV